jgi:hypothetical protein
VVRGQPTNISRDPPSPKITRAKWIGSVAQVVQHPLWKYEALSSNSSTTKKKKIEKKKVMNSSE